MRVAGKSARVNNSKAWTAESLEARLLPGAGVDSDEGVERSTGNMVSLSSELSGYSRKARGLAFPIERFVGLWPTVLDF